MFTILAFMLLSTSTSADERCRQALALGLDVSGSVDSREYKMQLDGLASALIDPEVQKILFSMPQAPVRLAVFEWSSPIDQTLLVPWTSLKDPGELARIALRLRSIKRTPSEQSTGLGSAMLFGAGLLEQQPKCWVRTLDLSGDGKSNTGPHPKDINADAIGNVTINALVIGADALDHGDNRQDQVGELSSYFKAYVLRGPAAFVEVALGFEDFENAMTRKLKRELEGMMLTRLTPIDQ